MKWFTLRCVKCICLICFSSISHRWLYIMRINNSNYNGSKEVISDDIQLNSWNTRNDSCIFKRHCVSLQSRHMGVMASEITAHTIVFCCSLFTLTPKKKQRFTSLDLYAGDPSMNEGSPHKGRMMHISVSWHYHDSCASLSLLTLIARFMAPTGGPPGADRTQVGPMLTPRILLSGQALQIFAYPKWARVLCRMQILSFTLLY